MNSEQLWRQIRADVSQRADQEPMLASFFYAVVLSHDNLIQALSYQLAQQLNSPDVSVLILHDVFTEVLENNPELIAAVEADLCAVKDRDPACDDFATPLLYFKGFLAIQSQRLSHALWKKGRKSLALFLQNRISSVFDVDIHPAAVLGKGIMLDHATGVVMGETSVVGDNVSILHSVTLGGSGTGCGDRHPKIGNGVLISAGAKVLGNIHVGDGAKIAAGSVVLEDVPAHTTVAGVPARIVGRPSSENPALEMDQNLSDDP